MKITDIRIGNYVLMSGQPFKVESIHFNEVTSTKKDLSKIHKQITSVKGVKISEDWLLKVGFEKSKVFNDRFYAIKTHQGHFYLDDKFQPYMTLGVRREFKYIHEIQNLFHAMIGYDLPAQ